MLKNIIVIFIIIMFLFPYYWMVSFSLEPISIAIDNKPHWFPVDITFDNYLFMFRLRMFPKWVFNSLFIPGMAIILTCTSASMAGFVLAKRKFPGSQLIFILMISTMAIPGNTILIPKFLMMKRLGLIGTYPSLFIVYMASAFGVFLMKQVISTIPTEIIESGMIDGASDWQIFWKLVVPIARPGIIALGMFTFVGAYGDYFWQLLMIRTDTMKTLPLAIMGFMEQEMPKTQLMMAAALLASLPLLILYALFHKYFIEGPSLGSIK